MNLCRCGCGNPVGPGKTWLRGHNMRAMAPPPDPDDTPDDTPDDIPDDASARWWEQRVADAAWSYDAAAAEVPNDPDPARMPRTPDTDGPPPITRALIKDIEGKLAFWGSVGVDLWNMVDPYCAGAAADNVDKIARKATPLMCQSPTVVKFLTNSTKFVQWTELGMACKPVIVAVIAHHVTKRVTLHPQTREAQQADWKAYAAA